MSIPRVTHDFKNIGIRSCDIDGTRYISVLDFIVFATGVVKGTKIWSELKHKFSDEFQYFTFAGQGAKETPVVEASVLIKVISKLKGDRAECFREKHLDALLEIEDGTLLFDALRDALTAFAEHLLEQADIGDSDSDDGEFVLPRFARVIRCPRNYEATSIYVRVRLPDDHASPVVKPKALTLRNIKFGVAYSLHDRNTNYGKDNGFFAFAFHCSTRFDADLVERWFRHEYAGITVLNAKEYLSTDLLADKLGIKAYDPDSYESYVNVARTLFMRIVERVKIFFQGRYDDIYGVMYTATMIGTDLIFPADTITRDLAAKFGYRHPEVTWKTLS